MDTLPVKEPPADAGAPKTFFIFPNPTLITETFLEAAFLSGFECYSIPGILGADYQQIVETLLNTYQMSVLFFFLDKDEKSDYLVSFLGRIQKKYAETTRLGVFYAKPAAKPQEQAIQRSFLLDIGIEAGCVPLENSVEGNHTRILDVLAANEVAGRRKAIRMTNESNFSAHIVIDDVLVEIPMLDLSVSHFTIQLKSEDPGWEVGKKLNPIKLNLGDVTLSVRAIISLKRFVQGRPVFVFRFRSETNRDELVNSVVNKVIYKYYQKRTLDYLKERLKNGQ